MSDDAPADRDMASCPACWRTVATSELCGCPDQDYGPLCTWGGCCRRWHREEVA